MDSLQRATGLKGLSYQDGGTRWIVLSQPLTSLLSTISPLLSTISPLPLVVQQPALKDMQYR